MDTLLKEINFNKTRTDATFGLKTIGNTKIKHETLLCNLNKIINQSDISYIDYTSGGTLSNKPLQALNTLFSDNIVVYCPIDDVKIKNLNKLEEEIKKQQQVKIDYTDEEDINIDELEVIKQNEEYMLQAAIDEEQGKSNVNNNANNNDINVDDKELEDLLKEEEEDLIHHKILDKVAKELLPTFTATIKMVFNQLGITIKKGDISPIGVRNTDEFIYKSSMFSQLLKISLANVDVNEIFSLLESPIKIEYLHNNNIFIHDVDFTRDYRGVFNKGNVIKYLVKEYGFVKQGKEKNFNKPTIIKNSNYVSANCLTFIRDTSIGRIRYKFYNKFIQSMESPSVRKDIGSKINEWINNPEPILKRAIENSLDTGLLRLEFTIYTYKNNSNVTKDDVYRNMEYLEKLMPPHLIYYNSISNQFNLLCNNILYNTCIIDIDKEIAFICLYHNKLTGKANGFYLHDINTTKLNNALRYYCSNKPIIVVLLQLDVVNKEINIQQDCYIRYNITGESLYTYISKGSENLKAIQTKDFPNKPENVGLIPNDVFNFKYPSGTTSLLKSSTKAKIVFKAIEMKLLCYPNNGLTIRSVNRENKELANSNAFTEQYQQQLNNIKEQNENIESIVKESLFKELVRSKLYKVLSNVRAYTHKFVDLPNGTDIYVYGFKETTTRYGNTYLLACSGNSSVVTINKELFMEEEDNTGTQDNGLTITADTVIELYYAPTNITNYITKILSTNGFKQLDIKGINAYGSLSGNPIMHLVKESNYYNSAKNLCANVVIKDYSKNKTEDIAIDNSNVLQEISANIKECNNIDNFVKEGDFVKIIGYKRLKSSLIVKACINNGNTNNYIASYWLKELIINRLTANNNSCVEIITGVLKTTPQKKKCYLFMDK